MDLDVKGVLFDAGGVLIRPVGGRWNPRHDFERIVLRHEPGVDAGLFPVAIESGQRVLDEGETTPDRTVYHRAMLRVLGVERPSDALLRDLEAPASGPVVETYPEVPRVLARLHGSGVRMSVVSDSWAGLDGLFRALDIERYFEAFVISEVLGCRKPDPRMYRAGSDALGLAPEACAFLDDAPELVAAADTLGYHGVVVARDGVRPVGLRAITTLDELVPAR